VAIIYALLAFIAILFLWRYLAPADIRLNRRFLGRYLKDHSGRGPSSLRAGKLAASLAPGQHEEKVNYAVKVNYADGSSKELLVQFFYPLEALQAERQRQKQLSEGSSGQMEMSVRQDHDQSVPDQARRLVGDPYGELREEAAHLEQRKAGYAAELSMLAKMNSFAPYFPELIAHDAKENVVLLSAVGSKRLDHILADSEPSRKETILKDLLAKMAMWHAKAGILAPYLPAGSALAPAQMRAQMEAALVLCQAGGEPRLSPDEHAKLMAVVERVAEVGNAPKGIKMADASPRAFFASDAREVDAKPIDFGRVRQDVSLLDVIEIVCDPAIGLGPDRERALFEHYLELRTKVEQGHDIEQGRKMLRLLAIYYRLMVLGYINLTVPYWTKESIFANKEALICYLDQLSADSRKEDK